MTTSSSRRFYAGALAGFFVVIAVVLLPRPPLPRMEANEPTPDEAQPAAPNRDQIQVGMPASEVRRLLGRPNRIVRQILLRRQVAQWSYDGLVPFWIEIEHVRGQEAKVTAINPPSNARK